MSTDIKPQPLRPSHGYFEKTNSVAPASTPATPPVAPQTPPVQLATAPTAAIQQPAPQIAHQPVSTPPTLSITPEVEQHIQRIVSQTVRAELAKQASATIAPPTETRAVSVHDHNAPSFYQEEAKKKGRLLSTLTFLFFFVLLLAGAYLGVLYFKPELIPAQFRFDLSKLTAGITAQDLKNHVSVIQNELNIGQ